MNPDVRTPQYVIDLARKMRKNMTKHEALLWERINKKQILGYKFRRQHPIYRYICDFYCHKLKLAIELDGRHHDENVTYDEERDEFLFNLGIRTLRIKNEDIDVNIDTVIETITCFMEGGEPPMSP